MGPEHNFGNKFWWWRDGYRALDEPSPNLQVFAEKIADPTDKALGQKATNAFGDGWDAILVGMEFPSAGCWRVTGRYGDLELRMILEVGEH